MKGQKQKPRFTSLQPNAIYYSEQACKNSLNVNIQTTLSFLDRSTYCICRAAIYKLAFTVK